MTTIILITMIAIAAMITPVLSDDLHVAAEALAHYFVG